MDSLKKTLIFGFSNIPLLQGFENNTLILITAAGMITGTCYEPANDNIDSAHLLGNTCNTIADRYREERNIPQDAFLEGNDGFISLKDASITNGSTTINLPYLCVFYDEIIAVSVGNKN